MSGRRKNRQKHFTHAEISFKGSVFCPECDAMRNISRRWETMVNLAQEKDSARMDYPVGTKCPKCQANLVINQVLECANQ